MEKAAEEKGGLGEIEVEIGPPKTPEDDTDDVELAAMKKFMDLAKGDDQKKALEAFKDLLEACKGY